MTNEINMTIKKPGKKALITSIVTTSISFLLIIFYTIIFIKVNTLMNIGTVEALVLIVLIPLQIIIGILILILCVIGLIMLLISLKKKRQPIFSIILLSLNFLVIIFIIISTLSLYLRG